MGRAHGAWEELGLRSSPAEGASAVLALLDDVPASPASRRLASAPAALGTQPIVLSPRAVKPGLFMSSMWYRSNSSGNDTYSGQGL